MMTRTQTGLAMVIVIWVLSLMTIMAGSFALTMRRETTVISAVKDNAVALAAAETGLAIAQQMLLLADANRRWRSDGSVYQLQYQDAEIRVRILSEQGKIDINKANEVLLTTLMNSTSADMEKQQSLVSAILDWRDKDDLVHLNGAELTEYEEAGLSYQPANSRFQLIEELQMVLGMEAAIYQDIQPLITVYSGAPQVNLQLAPKEVLHAVTNLDSDVLDEYFQQRIESNRDQLPPPPFPLTDLVGGINRASSNEVYTVISQARFVDGVDAGLKVTMKKNVDIKQENPFQVLDWQQIYQENSLFNEQMSQLLVNGQDEPEHKN